MNTITLRGASHSMSGRRLIRAPGKARSVKKGMTLPPIITISRMIR